MEDPGSDASKYSNCYHTSA